MILLAFREEDDREDVPLADRAAAIRVGSPLPRRRQVEEPLSRVEQVQLRLLISPERQLGQQRPRENEGIVRTALSLAEVRAVQGFIKSLLPDDVLLLGLHRRLVATFVERLQLLLVHVVLFEEPLQCPLVV